MNQMKMRTTEASALSRVSSPGTSLFRQAAGLLQESLSLGGVRRWTPSAHDNYLSHVYPHTVVVISHDADFLDNICTDILHLENKKLVHYRGRG